MVLVLTAIFIIIIDPLHTSYKKMSFHLVMHTLLLASCGVSASGADIAEITQVQTFPVFYAMTSIIGVIPLLGVSLVTLQFIFKKENKAVLNRNVSVL